MDLSLPAGVIAQDFDGDLVITGPGLTAQAVEEIKEKLPEAIRSKVIGWRSSAR